MNKLIGILLWPVRKIAKIFCKGTFWSVFIPLIGLLLVLSPRPSIVISVDANNSSMQYVSAELKNVGNAAAFDVKYNLFSEIKTFQGNINIANPQDPLFHRAIFAAGQIYQGGRMTGVSPDMKITELLMRYEIIYRYSLINIPGLQWIMPASKIQGQLWWNGKKWDVR